MATDKISGNTDATSPLADRLFARSEQSRGIGVGSSLFRRLGLENPYEGGSVGDPGQGTGREMFSFLSSKAYFDELRGLSAVRRHLLWRIDSVRHRIRAGERMDRSTSMTSVRAAMFGLRPMADMNLVDWSTQVDAQVDAPAAVSVPADAQRASSRPTRSSAAERALRAQIAQASDVLAELQDVLGAAPAGERQSVDLAVREMARTPGRRQVAEARQAVRRLRGTAAMAARGSRLQAESSQLGDRPLAVAQGRSADEHDGPRKGLRRLLDSSPIAMALAQPEAFRAAPEAAVPRDLPVTRPPARREHAHRQVPDAAVVRDARTQSGTGLAGPPAAEGAVRRPTTRSDRALDTLRPTERIAQVAVQTSTARLTDTRRGLAASGRQASSTVTADQRVAARSEAGLPDASGRVSHATAYVWSPRDRSVDLADRTSAPADSGVRPASGGRAIRTITNAEGMLLARPAAVAEAPGTVDDALAGGADRMRSPTASVASSRAPVDSMVRRAVPANSPAPSGERWKSSRAPAARVRAAARQVVASSPAIVTRSLPAVARAMHRGVAAPQVDRRVALSAPPFARATGVDRRDVGLTVAPDAGSTDVPSIEAAAFGRSISRSASDRLLARSTDQARDPRLEDASSVRGSAAGSAGTSKERQASTLAVARDLTFAAPPAVVEEAASQGEERSPSARSAQRAVLSEGASRRGRALPTVRAAYRAIAQERSGARGRLLSPAATAHVRPSATREGWSADWSGRPSASTHEGGPSVDSAGPRTIPAPSIERRSVSATLADRRSVPATQADRPVSSGTSTDRRSVPEISADRRSVSADRLGGASRAASRALPSERIGPAGAMLSPRVVARFTAADPVSELRARRESLAADLGFSTLANMDARGAAVDATPAGDAPATGEPRTARSSIATRRAARLPDGTRRTPVTGVDVRQPVEAGRNVTRGAAGRIVERRAAGNAPLEGDAPAPVRTSAGRWVTAANREFVLAQPERTVEQPESEQASVARPGLASRAFDRAPAAPSRRSVLPDVTPEHAVAVARRVDAARRAEQSRAVRTLSGDTATTFAHRTVSGVVERTRAVRTLTGPTDRSEAFLTPAEALERSRALRTARALGGVRRTAAVIDADGLMVGAPASSPVDGSTSHASRRGPGQGTDAVSARPVPRSLAGVPREHGRSEVRPSVRPLMRTIEAASSSTLVPSPVSPMGAEHTARIGAAPTSVAGGQFGVGARPQGPGRGRLERALRAATAVHAGERTTPEILTLAGSRRALSAGEPTAQDRGVPARGRRFTAHVEHDAAGRLVRASVVDDATGMTLASPVRPAAPVVEPSTWAEGRDASGVAAPRRRATRVGAHAVRNGRGGFVPAPPSMYARPTMPQDPTVLRAGRALDGSEATSFTGLGTTLDALVGREPEATPGRAPRVETRALLRRRAWQRRGMAAEIGALAPVLADADYVPAAAAPVGSPAWVRRAVTGGAEAPRGDAASGPEAIVAGGSARGSEPVGAADAVGRAAKEQPVRQSGLMAALARADGPQDLVQVIVKRSAEIPGLRKELPAEAASLVERIAALGPDEISVLRAGSRVLPPAQMRTGGRGTTSRNRRTASEFHQLSATHEGVGANKITKLADKLMGLIHLAENSRVKEAQDQVRMAQDTTEARAEGGPKVPGMSVEDYDMNINALQNSVRDFVMEQFAELDSRREDPDGRNKWW
jgi:hypothetical protein